MDTVKYAPERYADVHGQSGPLVLLWHGLEPDMRGVLATLAGLLVERGCSVVVPDWSSAAEDRGRADLLQSMRFAQELATDRGMDPSTLVLVGWSLGGTAAAGLTIHARRLGIRLGHTVCLAGGFPAPDPISGEVLPGRLPDLADPPAMTLVHGIADDVVPLAASRTFAVALERAGWPVQIVELAADHASIAGTVRDAALEDYLPADDEATRAVAAEVADLVARATLQR